MRAGILRVLRVPHAPSAPLGDADIRVFRAGRNYFYYRLASWGAKVLAGVVGLFVAFRFSGAAHLVIPDRIRILGITISEPTALSLVLLVEILAVILFIAQAAFLLLLVRLDYEQRWYIVSDRSLRIREGLMKLHEKTMTFANIQNVTVEQGPLQRLLGIADLKVRTAGGGGSGSSGQPGGGSKDMHEAFFRGIEGARAVRELILERLRTHKGAGLGDEGDDTESGDDGAAVAGDSAADLALQLAAEARLLRAAMGPA